MQTAKRAYCLYYCEIKAGKLTDVNIEAKYYELLDRPNQRCNSVEGYSFTKCVEVRYENS